MQRTKHLAYGAVMGIVSLCGVAWSADITADTRIDNSNVDSYANEPLVVAADATLTRRSAPI